MMDEELLRQLELGPGHAFADWPNLEVPRVAAGVYTVWRGDEYLYAGMSGRGASKEELVVEVRDDGRVVEAKGLFTRLNAHATGRRSGDQFCIYICDRYIVPALTAAEQRAVGEGTLLLDDMTKDFIRGALTYRFLATEDGPAAHRLEEQARSGAMTVGRPLLNPLGPSIKQAATMCGVSEHRLRTWLNQTYGAPARRGRRELTDEQLHAAMVMFRS